MLSQFVSSEVTEILLKFFFLICSSFFCFYPFLHFDFSISLLIFTVGNV